MEEYYEDTGGIDFRDRKVIIAATVGSAVLTGFLGMGVGSLVVHSEKKLHLNKPVGKPGNGLHRDLSSEIMNMGVITPFAADPLGYIVVEENLPGPSNVPGSGNHIDITLNVPTDRVDHYHVGQNLTPQQTNDLIDGKY
ncbi:MAG TPA: hypothetical protein VMT96_00310 [Candidatus Bathyarchaeia archaeon]|nr:hypothetical protein [Candidatus Bathyarchaeia archaeon]